MAVPPSERSIRKEKLGENVTVLFSFVVDDGTYRLDLATAKIDRYTFVTVANKRNKVMSAWLSKRGDDIRTNEWMNLSTVPYCRWWQHDIIDFFFIYHFSSLNSVDVRTDDVRWRVVRCKEQLSHGNDVLFYFLHHTRFSLYTTTSSSSNCNWKFTKILIRST